MVFLTNIIEKATKMWYYYSCIGGEHLNIRRER
jgi:hypothetical protein